MAGFPDFHIDIDKDLDLRLKDNKALKAAALEAANKIADIARETAPVETGDYRDGIIVQATPRGARVLASSNKSAWIEFGVPANNEPAKFNLRNAAKAAGYDFEKH